MKSDPGALVLVGGKIVMRGEKAKMMNNAGVIRHYLGAARRGSSVTAWPKPPPISPYF